jgi:hypothetical protein
MSAFNQFNNPYRDPANVPAEYRNHPSLRKLFQANGSYTRPAESVQFGALARAWWATLSRRIVVAPSL